MPDTLYVPVLKGRQGELSALGKIQPITRSAVLPLLEIVPGESDDPESVRRVIDRTAKKLDQWGGERLMVDAGLLGSTTPVQDESGAAAYAVAKAREFGIGAIPVVRLADGELARNDVRNTHQSYQSGIAIRLNVEDMDEDPDDVNDAVSALLDQLSVKRADAILILDLGVVQGDIAVRAGSRMVLDVLRDADGVDEWRHIVVASGAFPADLSTILPRSIGDLPRYDAALYDALRGRRRLPRLPLFGDYGVSYPLLSSGPPFPAAPQLRYTVSDRWLVLKGKRSDPRGNEQFYEVCDTIAGHPEFAGAALGAADARIADSRAYGGPGNGSTWREIGTTHHLDFVVRRFTTVGEP
ncbi:beta family protein [Saccharothrix sp. NRRL B-16314]|uniref:beta family protein n=1 Tax=Saccharothrix sp. NRRL B-16314 TaxID=1463825 RepID=UPI0018CC2923|nr:beta family protein [Saccharothrix sp. NRRL B-16314]